MVMKTVLAIGIDPAFVDVSRFSGLTFDLLRNCVDAELTCSMALRHRLRSILS